MKVDSVVRISLGTLGSRLLSWNSSSRVMQFSMNNSCFIMSAISWWARTSSVCPGDVFDRAWNASVRLAFIF
jgi:hypothetical protein